MILTNVIITLALIVIVSVFISVKLIGFTESFENKSNFETPIKKRTFINTIQDRNNY